MPGRRLASSLVIIAVVVVGCGYSPADYCQDLCDCSGCSDQDLDECIDDAEDLYDNAVQAGCEDLADEYLACLDAEVECRGDDFDADGCEREYVKAAECVGESDPPDDDGASSSVGAGGSGAGSSGGSGGMPPGPGPTCDAPAAPPSGGSCITLAGDVSCNPVTNEPCAQDDLVCDTYGPSQYQCYSVVSKAPLCASCADSPCTGGTTCPARNDWPGGEQCAKFCCDDGDCGGGVCVKSGVSSRGADVGVCLTSAP